MAKHFLFFIIILFNTFATAQKTDFEKIFNQNRKYLVSDLKVCFKKTQEMQNLASKENDEYGLMLSDKLYCEIYIVKDDYKNVLKYANQAKKRAEALNDNLQLAGAYRILWNKLCKV